MCVMVWFNVLTQDLTPVTFVALNLVKSETTAKVGIKNKRLKAGWDERYLLKVMCGGRK